MQILKAPKTGTSYAECWPNAADSIMIVEAANQFALFLDWAENVAMRHYPVLCGCKTTHFLCAANRAYNWDGCPEVMALVRTLDGLHMGVEDEVA